MQWEVSAAGVSDDDQFTRIPIAAGDVLSRASLACLLSTSKRVASPLFGSDRKKGLRPLFPLFQS
jgi:hypothetical protein